MLFLLKAACLTNTNFMVFGFTRLGIEPMIYCTQDEDATIIPDSVQTYRITAFLKVETDIITSITAIILEKWQNIGSLLDGSSCRNWMKYLVLYYAPILRNKAMLNIKIKQ